MRLKLKHITLSLSLLALAACKESVGVLDPVEPTIPDSEKTPIELSVGGVDSPNPITRAVITDGTGKTMQNFDTNTKIFMIMKSEYSALTSPYEELNYGGAQTTKYTVSRGDVAASSNKVTFDSNNQRYWDDAHARSSKLNIWAYAQKGMSWTKCSFGEDDGNGGYRTSTPPFETNAEIGWRTAPIYPMIFNWKASHHDGNGQSGTSVMCQDLLFSNNLVNNSSTGTNIGGTDARLGFNTSNRKFPQEGEALMKFYHAMSKITIKIIEGEGFNTSSTTDFQFPTGTNVKLTGFNTEGLFSIRMGGFQQINNHAEIPSIYLKTINTSSAPYYTLEALTVPNIDEFTQTYEPAQNDNFSRFVSGKKDYSTDVMMEFTIDGNKYQVTSGQLYDALHVDGDPSKALVTNATVKTNNGTYIPMEAGKNYVFTFTVGKTKIKNITAQVADWEDVEAENISPTNARIKLQLEERGTEQTTDVAIYKANDNKTSEGIDDNYAMYNWKTGYANLEATYSTDHWTTNYFWESSKDFYHFRALMPDETVITTDGSGDGDYATLTSGASYTDVLWGAPMLDDGDNETQGTFKWNYGPTMNGFDGLDTKAANAHQIYKAIGPTEDPVKLILFHMMSDVTFNITTTTSPETNMVELKKSNGGEPETYNYTKLDLVGFYNSGKVLLGNGLVKTTGSPSTEASPVNIPITSTDFVYKYGAVPQDLTDVKLVITTPDNNQYIVDLADVFVKTITSNNLSNPYTKITSGTNTGKYQLNRWYPGFKYNYTFKLTKKGITDVKATIVEWETVEAEQDPVQIR